MDRIAFSVPGANGTPIPISPVDGMPHGGAELLSPIIQWVVAGLLVLVTLAALFFLIWGGISWIMSGGEEEKIAEARSKIVYAILGLIIAFLSFFIVNSVGQAFGFNLLHIDIQDKVPCSSSHPHGSCPSGKSCIQFTPGHYSCHSI